MSVLQEKLGGKSSTVTCARAEQRLGHDLQIVTIQTGRSVHSKTTVRYSVGSWSIEFNDMQSSSQQVF